MFNFVMYRKDRPRLAVQAGILVVGILLAAELRAQISTSASGSLPAPSAEVDTAELLQQFFPTTIYLVPRDLAPPEGLILEMSVAPPTEIPRTAYELAKYGRLSVDYTRAATIDNADFGVSAQALHVAHHLLFYSAGITSDINNDGMFLLTAGMAHYQTGNDFSPFVDAPFIRLRFQSSQQTVFAYSEIETTMHFRQFITGMAGFGFRLSPRVRLMGGFHHTEFVMPEQQFVQMVDGLEGILSWGM